MENDKITINFTHVHGEGHTGAIEIPAGTTIAVLIANELGGQAPNNLRIRLNRETVGVTAPTADHVLQQGDNVTAVPGNVKGAVQAQVSFSDNNGCGFSKKIDIPESITVKDFLQQHRGQGTDGNLTILVNDEKIQDHSTLLYHQDSIVLLSNIDAE